MATTAALSCWDHYANGSLTVTGFKIILLAWRQVIKLNFQPVDHMKVAKDGWIKRAMGRGALRGKRSRAPFSVKTRPDHPASCSPPAPPKVGWRRRRGSCSAWGEQKNSSARAASSVEFMSCSSTQGHCRTQTHYRDFLRFFIRSSRHNVLCRLPSIHFTWQEWQPIFGNQTYYLWAEPVRDWWIVSSRTRPTDPGCNCDGHLVCTGQED